MTRDVSSATETNGVVDQARFRSVLGRFPTGITVVTGGARRGGPVGFAVGSFFSVSLDPPLVGFCAARSSSSWAGIKEAGCFCVNVLADDQSALSRQFSMPSSDRFAGISWVPTGGGSCRLADVVAWIDCVIESVSDGGDHEICVGRVLDLGADPDVGSPLVFYEATYRSLAPKFGPPVH